MKLLGLLLLLISLASCVQQPMRLSAACPLTGVDTVLLSVSHAKTDFVQQLILHPHLAQPEGDKLEFVALDPIGARLFTGSINAGRIAIQTAPFYRGADPVTLIQGYHLWQQRERAQRCWPSGNQLLGRQPEGDLVLSAGRQTLAIWRPQTPEVIELPYAKLRISLREMD